LPGFPVQITVNPQECVLPLAGVGKITTDEAGIYATHGQSIFSQSSIYIQKIITGYYYGFMVVAEALCIAAFPSRKERDLPDNLVLLAAIVLLNLYLSSWAFPHDTQITT
jgi:hypothetical protein